MPMKRALQFFQETGFGADLRVRLGPGFFILDGELPADDGVVLREAQKFIQQRLHVSEFHPDVWQPTIVRSPADTHARLTMVAGDKYSYRQLDEFTDLLQKTMQTLPAASRPTDEAKSFAPVPNWRVQRRLPASLYLLTKTSQNPPAWGPPKLPPVKPEM